MTQVNIRNLKIAQARTDLKQQHVLNPKAETHATTGMTKVFCSQLRVDLWWLISLTVPGRERYKSRKVEGQKDTANKNLCP